MRFPHPCFLLLGGGRNKLSQRASRSFTSYRSSGRRAPSIFGTTATTKLHVSRFRPMEHSRPPTSDISDAAARLDDVASILDTAGSAITRAKHTDAMNGNGNGASDDGGDGMVVSDVPPAVPPGSRGIIESLNGRLIINSQEQADGGGKNDRGESMDISVPGSSKPDRGESMDISIPGSDVQMEGNDVGGSGAKKSPFKPVANGGSQLKSVEEEAGPSNGEAEEATPAAPSLHEHHHSLSTKASSASAEANADDGDKYDDDDDDDEVQFKRYSELGHCRSIEEASVNTTIESVTMEEAERLESPRGSLSSPRGSLSKEGVQLKEDLMPQGSSDTIESIKEEDLAEMHTPSDHHNVKLRLTQEEEQLFQLLADAAEAFEAGKLTIDPNPPQQSVSARGGFTKQESSNLEEASWLKPPPKVERIEIRVAGGWVRDKLLNQHSCDVDVALDCMMGVQFARIVQSYLALQNKEKEEAAKKLEGANGEGVNGANGDTEAKIDETVPVANEIVEHPSTPKSSKAGKKGGDKPKAKQQKQKKTPRIGVIGANPSQSKHLETATMNVHGMDVDFVNLRAEEVYESNSRIPTSDTRMFGTPLEDALRRDFTINSLFYNIRSHRIEDWTGRGLDDLLVHRRVVTPVDAHTTFHDDPLRVLRAIRFCVRLDFNLDDQIREAAMSKRVHHSLHVKVSRERVGKELEGMLTGKHARPARALDMIADLHLAGSVFAFPGSFPGDHDYAGGPVTGHILGVNYNCSLGTDSRERIELAASHRARGWEESSSLLGVLPTVMEGHADEREKVSREKAEKSEDVNVDSNSMLPTAVNERLLHLCVFILPFHSLTFPDKKGREVAVTAEMIKEALKFPVRDIQAVSKILSHVDEMAAILSEIRTQLAAQQQTSEGGGEGEPPLQLTPPCRLRAGLLLRSLKELWVTCLLTAAAWEIRTHQRKNEQTSDEAPPGISIPDEQPSREFYRAIVDDLDLDECWKVRPHLNGKEMIRELNLPKGPVVGVYLEDQTRWMLLNPKGTKEECMTHLRERKREREQECSGSKEGEEVVDDQNVVNVGVADGEGHSSAMAEVENGTNKHFSKKIRAEK